LTATPPITPPVGGDPTPETESQALAALRQRRRELAGQVLELHWDLGGVAYEMAIRDHFRLDVLVRRAALLQERDSELAEVERLLRLEEGASAGVCPTCAAPHSRGALFCWQCGTTLMERAPSAAMPGLGVGGLDAVEQLEAVGRPDTARRPEIRERPQVAGQQRAAAQQETGHPAETGDPSASEQDTVIIR
jgi:hypothetical protein